MVTMELVGCIGTRLLTNAFEAEPKTVMARVGWLKREGNTCRAHNVVSSDKPSRSHNQNVHLQNLMHANTFTGHICMLLLCLLTTHYWRPPFVSYHQTAISKIKESPATLVSCPAIHVMGVVGNPRITAQVHNLPHPPPPTPSLNHASRITYPINAPSICFFR